MAGIYLHIPWCRKVCVYCDFHFSVSVRNRKQMVECLIKELFLQKNFTGTETIETIYFGGGTPSVLFPEELDKLIENIYKHFNVSESAEITLEANPDDLSFSYLCEIKGIGINRLSIGIESFFDEDLKWMNRRHNSQQSVKCLENSIKAGFDNINIDLIYGLPGLTTDRWEKNLDIAFKYEIQHLSSYFLTLEPKTVYFHRVNKGLMKKPDEIAGIKHYEILLRKVQEAGFIQYEISNFSLDGFISRHNTSYWLQKPYLGIGPSANSFNGSSRQWNVRNNTSYIESLENNIIPCTVETLSIEDRYNEYVLTSLRTVWGADLSFIKEKFGEECYGYFIAGADPFFSDGKLECDSNIVRVTRRGMLFADGIISELFMVKL